MRGPIRTLSACLLVLLACEPPPPKHQTEGPAKTAAASPTPAAIPEPGADGLREIAGVRYLEFVTAGAPADADTTLPMIIAIHGLGDTPQAFAGLLRGFDRQARIIVPRGFDAFGDGWSWFPIRMADNDEAEIAAAISKAADALAPAVEALAAAYPTRGKPYVTGFSQGGMLSFALAVEHGELIAAALPVGGWLPEPLWPATAPDRDRSPPILAFHGEADTRVPHAPTKRAVEALDRLGYAVELRSYADVGHTISPPMYADLTAALRDHLDAPD